MTSTDHTRMLEFIRHTLQERLKGFINSEATPEVKERLEGVVKAQLSTMADTLKTEVPEIEAFMESEGAVRFRFLKPLNPAMHTALYRAGMIDTPYVAPYIKLTFVVGPDDVKLAESDALNQSYQDAAEYDDLKRAEAFAAHPDADPEEEEDTEREARERRP